MKNSIHGGYNSYFKTALHGVMAVAVMILSNLLFADHALAVDLSDVSRNIVNSIENTPGLLSGIAYVIGISLGTWGVMKAKDHVENPNQAQLRESISRLLAGGAFISLPITLESMANAIGSGEQEFDIDRGATGAISGFILDIVDILPTNDLNKVLANIGDSLEDVPGLISAGCYLAGLVLGAVAISNIRDHIDNPNNKPLKDGVIRLLIGGALFALPTVFEAAKTTISGDGLDASGWITDIFGGASILYSFEAGTLACGGVSVGFLGFGSTSVGGVMCNIMLHTAATPAFIYSMGYLAGIGIAVWGLFKIKDHVVNPQQTSAWDGIARLLCAGGLFSLSYLTAVAFNTTAGLNILPHTNTGFNESAAEGNPGGLDTMLVNVMEDIFAPATVLVNWFGYIAGIILIFVGVSRLLKSSQEGPRGPGGFGTIMTFVVAGFLLSFSPMVTALSVSLFNSPSTATYAQLATAGSVGMNAETEAHILNVISAIVKFMIFVGLVSIMRGFFIVRDVAEGSQQASMMAGVTHILGGALAVNLGPLIMAVQTTLGIEGYGIHFGSSSDTILGGILDALGLGSFFDAIEGFLGSVGSVIGGAVDTVLGWL